MTLCDKTVLVLGAGINGVAIARELLLNRVPVCLVDRWDIASGTTAYSSRLIHGGLRYLEYGDFSLVRESLDERERLLQLAPQFVQPLQLFIPVERRASGFVAAARKFLGWPAARDARPVPRGLWLVRTGTASLRPVRASIVVAASPRASVSATLLFRRSIASGSVGWRPITTRRSNSRNDSCWRCSKMLDICRKHKVCR